MSGGALVFLGTLGIVLVVGSAVIAALLVRRALIARRPDAPAIGDRPAAAQSDHSDRLRNLLLSRMSHDLRSPLNSVVTLSELLRDGNAGPLSIEQRRYVEVIRRNGQTLLALVNDILELAAVESGRVEIEIAPVDLAALVHDVADGAAPAAGEKGIPVHVSAPEHLVTEGDPDHLRQILQRLVEHAISETRNGYVEIAVDRAPDRHHALLRVHETAEALPEAARRALSDDREDFDDYVAGEPEFAERAPAALPLVVAARLARVMGLHIGVASSAADGVTFDLELPLAAATATATAPAVGMTATAPAGATGAAAADGDGALPSGPATGAVLLIEDDLLERQRVRELLEATGYEVTLAGSGEEGLALLRTRHFDAVVLDLVMPGMSGLDVLRAARTEERLADVPFVVLSALYMTKSERAVLGPKVASVVRKGDATGEELAQSLRRAIKSTGGDARPIPGGHGGAHA
jgi:signal transduction histidine kinase/CheY-like chemotaxis protein